jgi:hypothetical protein
MIENMNTADSIAAIPRRLSVVARLADIVIRVLAPVAAAFEDRDRAPLIMRLRRR